ncbi:hypothetical protein [Rhizobium sp. NXC24]|uniref:hypothetical protein n=1 Tax=Rhizobium sp. NXC24 TaxID=2048897 RepID=UPI000CDF446A|nr:hypothetical protein [Rhizobium sp. NXC24]AVA21297.1 hypothetical protein NXC24_CH01646 [Rhizobium sp. NXC24]
MTRLLEPIEPGLAGKTRGDGFLSRLAKFIPSETGTLFTICNATLSDNLGPETSGKLFLGLNYWSWSLVVLLACFLGNILLLSRMYDKEYKGVEIKRLLKARHIFASSCGFVIWAYAIKSPVFSDYYKEFFSLLLIGLFLIIVDRVKPPKLGG